MAARHLTMQPTPATTPTTSLIAAGDRPLIYLGAGPADGRAPVVYAHPTRGPSAFWDLVAAPHGLIVGGTGGGKTSLLRTISKGALDRGMRVFGGDGKEAGSLSLLKGAVGVEAVEAHPLAIAAMIEHLYLEMRDRYQTLDTLRDQAWRTRTRPPAPPDWTEWLVIIDEVNSLLSMLPPQLRRQVVSWLVDLGRRSRESRIHLLLAMQNPRARAIDAGLDPELKQQLGLRVALGEIDGSLAGMAFDNYDLAGMSQGEHVPRGRGLAQVGTVWTAFQSAYLPDPCHWDTTDAECELAWRLLPSQDPDWEMWSARHGIDLGDDATGDPDIDGATATARPSLPATAGLTTLGAVGRPA